MKDKGKSKEDNFNVTLTSKFSPKLTELYDQHAKLLGLSRSEFHRYLFDLYLKEQGKKTLNKEILKSAPSMLAGFDLNKSFEKLINHK